MTDASGTASYHYDALGSLRAVDLPDGRHVEYVVDGQGRRFEKRVNGTRRTTWLYGEGQQIVAQYAFDSAGNFATALRFVYGTSDRGPDEVYWDAVRLRILKDQPRGRRALQNTARRACG